MAGPSCAHAESGEAERACRCQTWSSLGRVSARERVGSAISKSHAYRSHASLATIPITCIDVLWPFPSPPYQLYGFQMYYYVHEYSPIQPISSSDPQWPCVCLGVTLLTRSDMHCGTLFKRLVALPSLFAPAKVADISVARYISSGMHRHDTGITSYAEFVATPGPIVPLILPYTSGIEST
jgi:hypothetical protein